MNIQIDTEKKILKVDALINLGEFHMLLNKFFPNDEWKEYTLDTQTVITNWNTPIIVERDVYPDRYPWWQRPYYVGNIPVNTSNSNSLYNISVHE